MREQAREDLRTDQVPSPCSGNESSVFKEEQDAWLAQWRGEWLEKRLGSKAGQSLWALWGLCLHPECQHKLLEGSEQDVI